MKKLSRLKKRRIIQQARKVSLKQLLHDVGVIANKHGQNYFSAKCELKTYRPDRTTEVTYTVYVHGATHIEGGTPEEALNNLKEYYNKPTAAQMVPADILV